MSEKTVQLPIYISEHDRDRIHEAAEALGKATASEFVREAIIEFMVKHNQSPISNNVNRGGNRRKATA